jgi:hypothetical protein
MDLDVFISIIFTYRTTWFPEAPEFLSCCDPAGTTANSHGTPMSGLRMLEDAGITPVWMDTANQPPQRMAAVNAMKGYMRRLDAVGQPAFGVDDARWVVVSADGEKKEEVLGDGFESGYVWKPGGVSFGNKMMDVPKQDGWYDHLQNCAEYILNNFGTEHKSVDQVAAASVSSRLQSVRVAQLDHDEYDSTAHARRRRGRRGQRGSWR